MNTQPPIDHELESLLRGEDSRVAGVYRKLPQPEPDPALDAAVRAMARRALQSAAPVRARRPRWMPTLAAAAVIALAAGVAMRMGPRVWSPSSTAPALQSPVMSGQRSEPLSSAVTAKPFARDLPAAAPAPQPMQSPPAAAAARMSAPPPASAKSSAAARPAPARPAATDERERASTRQMPKAETAAAPEAFPPPASPARKATPQSVPVQQAHEAQDLDGAAAATTPSRPATSPHAAPQAKDANALLYPEHWLANIRQALHEGKRDEALRSLANFRKRYPDYTLPEDLRDLR